MRDPRWIASWTTSWTASWATTCLIAGWLLLGCGVGEDVRGQAQALTQSLDALGAEGSIEAREAKLHEIDKLPLIDRELRRARHACATAHRALLGAERSQRDAHSALLALQAKYPDDGVPDAELRPIASAIADSDAALVQAKQAFPACTAWMRKIVERLR